MDKLDTDKLTVTYIKHLRNTISTQWTVRRALILLAVAGFAGAGVFFPLNQAQKKNLSARLAPVEDVAIGALPIIQPTIKYGFTIDTFHVVEGVIKSGVVFGDLLQKHHIGYPTIEKLIQNSKEVFNISRLVVGKNYMILAKDSTQAADYFIYEPSPFEYIVFDLKDSLNAKIIKRPVVTKTEVAGGIIKSNLWNTMVKKGMNFELAVKMESALQWSIDFHRVQPNDEFKLIYDEQFIDGKSVGIGNVHAAYYKTGKDEFYAIFYETDDIEKKGYYDIEGRPMNKGFLKAPVKTFRISSGFNLTRFHPILKRVKAHLGTDYAAPYGTPIHAVGNGTIIQMGYTQGNGNYIKIKHDKTYETQYLHMQGFAKGMKVGKPIRQDEIIGYVGSTGLATGPHVCFRFWKNGQQVNHLALKFPPPNPLPEGDLQKFISIRDEYLKALNALTLARNEEEATSLGNP